MKKCTKCKQTKSFDQFFKDRYKRDGYRCVCKKCMKTHMPKKRVIETLPDNLKRCTKCKKIKDKSQYWGSVDGRDGLQAKCIDCARSYRKKWEKDNPTYYQDYDKEQGEERLAKKRAYYQKNKEYFRKKFREYAAKMTAEEKRERHRKWRNANREHVRKCARDRWRKRYYNDNQFRLAAVLRSRQANVLRNKTKVGSMVRDLGCTLEEFEQHIESQFEEGMTWDNWGKGNECWNLDHIKPLHLFDLEDREEWLEACHYTNIRPLWEIDNLSRTYEEFYDEDTEMATET